MGLERDLLRLEKEILKSMTQIKSRQIKPAESNIARQLNLIKKYDEALFTSLIQKYKQVLDSL